MESSERASQRLSLVLVAAGIVLFLILGLLSINAVTVGVFQDDVIYLTSGTSLFSGEGYRIGCLPGTPLNGKYPPLFAVVLGLLGLVFPPLPQGLVWFKLAALLMAVPAIGFGILWLIEKGSGRLPRGALILLALALGVHAISLFVSKEVLSEGLYSSLSVFVVWQLARKEADGSLWEWGSWIPLVLLSVACFYVRAAGVALLAALALFALWRGQRAQALAALVIGLVGIAPWAVWAQWYVPAHEPLAHIFPYFTGYGYHVKGVRELLSDAGRPRIFNAALWMSANAVLTLDGIRAIVFPDPRRFVETGMTAGLASAAFAIGTICLAGLVRLLRKREFAALYSLLMVALVCVWPWPAKARLLMPLSPFLVFAFVDALSALCERLRSQSLRLILPSVASAGLLLANVAATLVINVYLGSAPIRLLGAEKDARNQDPLLSAVEWIRENVPTNAVIVTGSGGLFYHVHTGRAVCPQDEVLLTPGEHLGRLYGLRKAENAQGTGAVARVREIFPDRPLYYLHTEYGMSGTGVPPTGVETWDTSFLDPNDGSGVRIVRFR